MDEHEASGLSPEQEAEVRRLLAEARHDEPIPADVADRLDRVLVGLAAEAGKPPVAPAAARVTDLDARRRRRTAGRLLLAAAAVVVGGVAVGQVIGSTADDDGGGADSSAVDTGVERDGGDEEPEAPEAEDASGGNTENAPAEARALRPVPKEAPVQLSSRDFDDQARRASLRKLEGKQQSADATTGSEYDTTFGAACPKGPYGPGLLLPVYYDGEPAVLAIRPPIGSDRLVELLECKTADLLKETLISDD